MANTNTTTTTTAKPATATDVRAHNEAINAKLRNLPAMPGGARKARALVACECGCGGTTQRRFVPGHDARLAGWVKRCERGLLVQGGDFLDQVEWIAANASEGEAAAVRRVLEASYGDISRKEEAAS